MRTLDEVERFLRSPSAVLYGEVCREWGLDPAQGEEDDVIAWAIRTGLAVRMWLADAERAERARAEMEA